MTLNSTSISSTPTQGQFLEGVYSNVFTRLSTQRSLRKYSGFFALGTSAGDDTFSQKLKPWRFFSDQTISPSFAFTDPMLASQLLRVVTSHHKHNIIVKNQPPSLDLSWYKKATEPTKSPLKPSDLTPIITGLTNLLKAGYFAELDRLLMSFDIKKVAPEIMVTILRTTFPARRKLLRNWSKLLKDVRAELFVRKLDADKILRGLT